MRKVRKRDIFLVIYFTLLAFAMANYASNATASTQTWAVNQQVAYMLPSSDVKHANISTFQIIDINTTTDQANASWDDSPKEPFPFIFTSQNVTDFLSNSEGAGNPPFGTSTFGKKQVQWINKTNAIPVAELNTSYLAYLIQPTHVYYVLIDQNTGIVVQLGDATDGTIILQLTEWPEQFTNWNVILIVIAVAAAFLIFIVTFRYSMRELRISPRNNTFDKVRIYFSATVFAGVISAVSIFVITIMLSAIGGNWTLALHFGVQQVNPSGTTYVRPLDPDWQVEYGFISALNWPVFIPIAALLSGIYVVIYPFFEMGFLTKKGSDAPTEIQQVLENNVIDRAPRPLNYILAGGFLFLVYIVPTYIIYTWFKGHVVGWNDVLQLSLLLVAITWCTIPAIFFLNYYASFGIATALWTTVGRGFKSPQKKDNLKNFIIIIFVLILLITTCYNFFDNIYRIGVALVNGNLLDMLPSIVLQDPSGGMQFLTQFARVLIQLNPFDPNKAVTLWNFDQFVTIIPLDLLIFLLTVCLVGIFGFYTRFLSREPLNRPILVLFASYIMAAIGVNVFINVILRLPNAYPGGFLVDTFTNPNGYVYGSQAYWNAYWSHYDTIRLLFFIPYFANYALMFIMVVYNIGFNKHLRDNIYDGVLRYAIEKDRLDILSKFTNSKNRRTKKVILENVYRIVKTLPSETSKIIEVLQQFVVLDDRELNQMAIEALEFFSKNYAIRDCEPVFRAGLTSPINYASKNVADLIVRIGETSLSKVIELYNLLITGDLTTDSQNLIVDTLERLRSSNPEVLSTVLVPLLDKEASNIRQGVLKILKLQVAPLREKYAEMLPKLLEITKSRDDIQVQDATEILGNIAAFEPKIAANIVLDRLDELRENASAPLRKKIVGALMEIAVALPDRIDELSPKVLTFLSDPEPEVRGEVGEAMGMAGVAFVGDEKFDYVEVVLRKLMADPSEQVRILGAKAVALIGKANPVLLQADPEYIEMVDLIIQDTSEEVREKAVDLFTYLSKVNPSMLIFNIPIKMLSKNFSVESCRTLMRIIHNNAEEFPWEEDIDLILKPLLAFNREDELVRNKIVEIIFVIIRARFQTFAQLYPLLKEFLLDESDMVASAASQALGELAFMKVRNPEFVIDVPVDDVVDLLLSQCQSRQSLFVLTAVEYVSKIFNLRKEIYQKIFPVFLSLQDNGHPGVVQYVALVLTAIVCENKAEFASRVNPKTGEAIWIVKTKFTEEFLPALLQIMSVPGKVVKEAVTIAVNMVIDNFPEAEVEVGEFLKKAAHKADSEQARIMGISVLGKYARTLEDMELLQVLVKASRDRKSKEMRQRALKALVSVINKFPQPKELNAKQIKCLQYLSFSLLRTSYLRDTVPQVRKYYIGALVAIGTNQYEFGGIFPFLRQLILDPDATNSSIAIRGFFNIMKQYPSHLELYYHYFRGFGFSPHDITRRILKEEIRHILELTGTIEYVLPTILLLTGDQDRDIRQSAFEDFKTLIDKYPNRVNYFGQLLLKMTRDKNFHIRADSIEVIATFLDKYPNAGEESEDLFQAFIDLSRDPIKSVRHQVAKYVADVVQLVTPDQVNFIFQALFRFIREEDRGMKEHTLNGFRAAAAIFPDRVPDILADLQRINKREQVASLQDLISEFKQFLAEQKASRKKK